MTTASVASMPDKALQQKIEAGEHSWLSAATKDEGRMSAVPDPLELVLGALGACTSMTVQICAQRRGWALWGVNIQLSEETVDNPYSPGRQKTELKRSIKVDRSLTPSQLKSLTGIAVECPIHKLLVGHKIVTTNLRLAS